MNSILGDNEGFLFCVLNERFQNAVSGEFSRLLCHNAKENTPDGATAQSLLHGIAIRPVAAFPDGRN